MKNEIFLDKSTMKRLFGNVVDKQVNIKINYITHFTNSDLKLKKKARFFPIFEKNVFHHSW